MNRHIISIAIVFFKHTQRILKKYPFHFYRIPFDNSPQLIAFLLSFIVSFGNTALCVLGLLKKCFQQIKAAGIFSNYRATKLHNFMREVF